jgi:putative tricarboxylic transport membrane protein
LTRDVTFGIATFAIACGYYVLAAALQDTQLADAVGPRGLPKAYAMLLAGLSLILILRGLPRKQTLASEGRAKALPPREESVPLPPREAGVEPLPKRQVSGPSSSLSWRQAFPSTTLGALSLSKGRPASTPSRAAGVLVIGIAYVVLVPWLGYVVALAGLIAATTYYQGGVLNRQVAIVAVAGAGFFWFMFVWLLHIRQPAGVWSSLF